MAESLMTTGHRDARFNLKENKRSEITMEMTNEKTALPASEEVKQLTPAEIEAFRQQQKALEQQRKEIQQMRIDAQATSTLATMGLPAEYKQFILADSEQEIATRATKLAQMIEREAEKKATEKTKSRYSTSTFGTATNTTINPFAKETFNLTQQGRLLRDNPAEAHRLAALAGVTIS